MVKWCGVLAEAVMAAGILLSLDCELSESSRSSSRGSRISRSRSSTRITRKKYGSVISSTRSRISKLGWKKSLLIGGILYVGSSYYLSRSNYRRYPNRRPTICSNYAKSDNNGTVYGMFICPMRYNPDDFTQCCGNEGEQRCCRYFDGTTNVVGIVIGSVVACVVLAVIVYCLCRRKQRHAGHVIEKDLQDYSKVTCPLQSVPAEQPPIPMTGKMDPAQPAAAAYVPPPGPTCPLQPQFYPQESGAIYPPVYPGYVSNSCDSTAPPPLQPYPGNVVPPYPPAVQMPQPSLSPYGYGQPQPQPPAGQFNPQQYPPPYQ